MENVSEPCTPYQNHHHQLTVERKGAGSDGKSLPAAYNGMSNINSIYVYIRQLPTVVKHYLMVRYADDHTLLKIIPDRSDRAIAESQLNDDLEAMSQFVRFGK